jgi:hypothetical protein
MILPDPAMKARYDRRYDLYLRLSEAMRPMWGAFAREAAAA